MNENCMQKKKTENTSLDLSAKKIKQKKKKKYAVDTNYV